eukprot:TRINITY_DN1264_c2_g3_i3.p1 TRINITY_DN1264_c2_g3~~TRINITY_DN1264_c2_g3_i3.p1  ORF type:complete len:548 (-),score=134.10 TRINITY_DN1264_c2_g3_i3:1442-3040(-)
MDISIFHLVIDFLRRRGFSKIAKRLEADVNALKGNYHPNCTATRLEELVVMGQAFERNGNAPPLSQADNLDKWDGLKQSPSTSKKRSDTSYGSDLSSVEEEPNKKKITPNQPLTPNSNKGEFTPSSGNGSLKPKGIYLGNAPSSAPNFNKASPQQIEALATSYGSFSIMKARSLLNNQERMLSSSLPAKLYRQEARHAREAHDPSKTHKKKSKSPSLHNQEAASTEVSTDRNTTTSSAVDRSENSDGDYEKNDSDSGFGDDDDDDYDDENGEEAEEESFKDDEADDHSRSYSSDAIDGSAEQNKKIKSNSEIFNLEMSSGEESDDDEDEDKYTPNPKNSVTNDKKSSGGGGASSSSHLKSNPLQIDGGSHHKHSGNKLSQSPKFGKFKFSNKKEGKKKKSRRSRSNHYRRRWGPDKYSFDDINIIGEKELQFFNLRVIHQPMKTGFEDTRDFPIVMRDIVAGRYEVVDNLGSAAFSRCVQCLDHKSGKMVCVKIIKNTKDFFDQCLDEVKLLRYISANGDPDQYNILKMFGV